MELRRNSGGAPKSIVAERHIAVTACPLASRIRDGSKVENHLSIAQVIHTAMRRICAVERHVEANSGASRGRSARPWQTQFNRIACGGYCLRVLIVGQIRVRTLARPI